MNIAMMVRGYIPAPRPSDMIYAPIDLAVDISKGLVARGHKVTFYGPQGTYIQGVDVETLNVRPLVHNQKEFGELLRGTDKQMHYVPGSWDRKFANEMFRRARAGEHDLLYFHHPEIALGAAQLYPNVPIAYTLHDPIQPIYREMYELFHSENQHFISISDNQRRDGPDIDFCQTIYNGINTDEYEFSEEHEDYLLFAGRIVPEKGVKEAIEIAQATNHRLLIIGPVYDDQQEYFNQYVKPHLDDKILYLGFMEREQVAKYYQKAKALLLPIQWEEPFGLVMTEAMASGTPVIALNRGSVSEVVVDGKTGFVCHHLQDMIEAVGKIDQIKRSDCRRHVEDNFGVDKMVDAYEAVFKAIIDGTANRPKTPSPLRRTTLQKLSKRLFPLVQK